MSKYIDAEKLLAEIVELRKELPNTIEHLNDEESGFARGQQYELTAIEAEILCLQQEQPDNEDIDKVAQELYEHLYELKRRNNVPTNLYDKQEIIDLWKAGIEYGRNHPKQVQEQPEVDLEKELDKYLRGEFQQTAGGNFNNYIQVARHFYELGRTKKEK